MTTIRIDDSWGQPAQSKGWMVYLGHDDGREKWLSTTGLDDDDSWVPIDATDGHHEITVFDDQQAAERWVQIAKRYGWKPRVEEA